MLCKRSTGSNVILKGCKILFFRNISGVKESERDGKNDFKCRYKKRKDK